MRIRLRFEQSALCGGPWDVAIAASARHAVRALFEEGVGAVSMTKIEVLPRRASAAAPVVTAAGLLVA